MTNAGCRVSEPKPPGAGVFGRSRHFGPAPAPSLMICLIIQAGSETQAGCKENPHHPRYPNMAIQFVGTDPPLAIFRWWEPAGFRDWSRKLSGQSWCRRKCVNAKVTLSSAPPFGVQTRDDTQRFSHRQNTKLKISSIKVFLIES